MFKKLQEQVALQFSIQIIADKNDESLKEMSLDVMDKELESL